MNPINNLFDNMSDVELFDAISEIQQGEVDGLIKEDGIVRKYAKLTGEITGGLTITDFYMVQMNLLKQAAYRWKKFYYKK
jgi:hypothetical protein